MRERWLIVGPTGISSPPHRRTCHVWLQAVGSLMQSRSIEPRSQMDVPRSMMSKHLWDSGNSYWHQGEKASTYFSCSSSSSHVSLTLLDLLCASNAFEFLTTSNPSWSRSRMDWLQKGRHCSRSFCEAFTSRSRFCEAFTSRFRFSACNRTSGCQTYVSQQTSSSLSARHLKTHTHTINQQQKRAKQIVPCPCH